MEYPSQVFVWRASINGDDLIWIPQESPMVPFRNILVATDSEEKDRSALNLALRLARKSNANLTIAQVLPSVRHRLVPDDIVNGNLGELLIDAGRDELLEFLGTFSTAGVSIQPTILSGHTAMELTREVMRNGHDLLIRTAGARAGIMEDLLGSVDMRLLRKCPCPVWVLRPGPHSGLKRILAAVDSSSTDVADQELNRRVLEFAEVLAGLDGADVHVLHAWTPWGDRLLRSRMSSSDFEAYENGMRIRSKEAFSDLLEPYDGLIPTENRHFIEGEPEEVVPEFSTRRRMDTVVMGTVARTGVPGFFIGNTAEMILERLPCSVFAIKPEGFLSPVSLEDPS